MLRLVVFAMLVLLASDVVAADRVLVVFSATWCDPCKRFKLVVNDAEVKSYILSNYDHAYSADIDKPNSKKFKAAANVRSVPTVAVFDIEGEKVTLRSKIIGALSKQSLLDFLKRHKRDDRNRKIGKSIK